MWPEKYRSVYEKNWLVSKTSTSLLKSHICFTKNLFSKINVYDLKYILSSFCNYFPFCLKFTAENKEGDTSPRHEPFSRSESLRPDEII